MGAAMALTLTLVMGLTGAASSDGPGGAVPEIGPEIGPEIETVAGPVTETLTGPVDAAVRPGRVVSINLCTDQLAMMLAAPGQLLSVSHLAADPQSSAMADRAAGYQLNRGRAEEVWLMQPDLVLADAFTDPATVALLRRLGLNVAVTAPAYGMADIPARLREVGVALGRAEAADRAVAAFQTRLAALREEVAHHPRAALYYANGYTSGDSSLAGEIIATAGFANIAGEAGVPAGGHLPLEVLALAAPELVISGRPYPGGSRSEEVLHHPVLTALQRRTAGAVHTSADWVCATPHVLEAIEEMRETRRRMERR
ncbi:ABC transporter substrate-binding protein [Pseudooceanicola sp. C21-150M6]|uniref:ABC transporter substrate-binding protein n=1 Tax=Pseudooceanicola sp. C21-150M6 TaxID=3434355 RepID=UPI003D7F7204